VVLAAGVCHDEPNYTPPVSNPLLKIERTLMCASDRVFEVATCVATFALAIAVYLLHPTPEKTTVPAFVWFIPIAFPAILYTARRRIRTHRNNTQRCRACGCAMNDAYQPDEPCPCCTRRVSNQDFTTRGIHV